MSESEFRSLVVLDRVELRGWVRSAFNDVCACGAKRSEHGDDGRCFSNPAHPFYSKRFTPPSEVK